MERMPRKHGSMMTNLLELDWLATTGFILTWTIPWVLGSFLVMAPLIIAQQRLVGWTENQHLRL